MDSVKKKKKSFAWFKSKTAIIFYTVVAIFFAMFFVMPTVVTITDSFMSETEITANYGSVFPDKKSNSYISKSIKIKIIPDKVTFDQYIEVLFKNSQYLLKFWNSVILTVPITIFQLVIASFTAYGFSRCRGKLKEIIFFAYVIINLMPYQVTLVPNYLVCDKLGILDTRWAVLLPGIFSPFAVFLLTKVMRRIPSAYIEAAKLDGAGEWRIFTMVFMPMCKSSLVSVGMLVFIDYWNMVEQPLILMKDSTKYPLSVFLSEINSGDIALAFAVATIYMIPTLLMFLIGEEALVEGIAYSGGIKG